ncbi:hypothetical protein [Pseudonocardia pini]|uniref:hypothetical protein n=1 Tax=Pseudonocardia pini TaxID=2758030 RepID=UPI001C69213E|nr:hypothetical protein [Pseudonocardia pini]
MTVPAEPQALLDLDLLAAAALACPLVADLHPGPYGEVATYLPGRRIVGVRASATAVEIHVVAVLAPSMTLVADQVRAAVRPWSGGLPVDVTVEDVLVPGDEPPRPEPVVPEPVVPGPVVPEPVVAEPAPEIVEIVEIDEPAPTTTGTASAVTVDVTPAADGRPTAVSVEVEGDTPVVVRVDPTDPTEPPGHPSGGDDLKETLP